MIVLQGDGQLKGRFVLEDRWFAQNITEVTVCLCVDQQLDVFYSRSELAASMTRRLLKLASLSRVCRGSSSTSSRSCMAYRSTRSFPPERGERLKCTLTT